MMVIIMNRNNDKNRITIERFAKWVEIIKKSIIFYIKQTKKLMKQVKGAKSENDRTALLNKIRESRLNAERYRFVLDDLTCAFVRENINSSEKVWKHFKYKTAEGFLMDRDAPGKPTLSQMIEIIVEHMASIAMIYQVEYDEFGTIRLKRNMSMVKAVPTIMNFQFKDRQTVMNAVSSGTRHK